MRFAVIACSKCHAAWATETRHASATCPRCATKVDVETRRRLWEGESMIQAQREAGRQRALLQGIDPAVWQAPPKEARHDSPTDAAAAKASVLVNKSSRAESVALWMTRLVGATPHAQLIEALERAGLDLARSEAEIVRMLATDILYEPRAGYYAVTG